MKGNTGMRIVRFLILCNILFAIIIQTGLTAQTINWSNEVAELFRRNSTYSRREFISSDRWNNCYAIYETGNSGSSDITVTKYGNGLSGGWTRTYNSPENYSDYALGIQT